jgi:hypothetical protein
METFRIYEIDYSVSPGGVNSFEVYPDLDNDYDTGGYPLYETEHLEHAIKFCYNNGVNFSFYGLAQNELDELITDPAPAVRDLTNVSAY